MTRNEWLLKKVIERNSPRSFGARHNMAVQLFRFIRWLAERYPQLHLQNVGTNHVTAFVEHLRDDVRINHRSIKNILVHLRTLATGLRKANIVHRSNKEYWLNPTVHYACRNRAVHPTPELLERIRNPHIRLMVEGMVLFGFRAKEASLIRPAYADRGHYLALKGNWCKGGRPRNIAITTADQRDWVQRAKDLAQTTPYGSMIPAGRDLGGWLRTFHETMKRLGVKGHGFRHYFAHALYRHTTGMEPPVAGGPTFRAMSPEQKVLAKNAYEFIAEQLGHNRTYVAAAYLGRMR